MTNAELKTEIAARIADGRVGYREAVEPGCNVHVQTHYEVLMDNGVPHWLAAMQAVKRTPGEMGTKVAFLRGKQNNQEFDHLAPDMREFYLGKAKEAGVNIRGKVYIPGLAKEAGDHRAWVSDQSEVAARCRQEGWGCDGIVKVKNRDAD